MDTPQESVTMKQYFEEIDAKYIALISYLRERNDISLSEIEKLYNEFVEDRNYLAGCYSLQFRNELSKHLTALGYQNARFIEGKVFKFV